MLNVLNLYLQVHGGDGAVKFWIFSRLHCKSVFESRTAMQWYIFMSIFYLKLSDSQSTFNFREVKENRRDQDDKHMQIFPGFLLKIVMLQPITAPVKVICRVSHFFSYRNLGPSSGRARHISWTVSTCSNTIMQKIYLQLKKIIDH